MGDEAEHIENVGRGKHQIMQLAAIIIVVPTAPKLMYGGRG